MRCFVYYNLHRHCLSVRALSGPERGRVIAHANALLMENVTFKVSEAGRQRVLRERAKNVHAGLIGELLICEKLGETADATLREVHENACSTHKPLVTYDPYRDATFVVLSERTPIYTTARILAVGKRVFVL
jgi:hypothetical protein